MTTPLLQQVINVGSEPNDGLGDSIRLSYQKCNNNFTQLFQAVGNITGGGSGMDITANVITGNTATFTANVAVLDLLANASVGVFVTANSRLGTQPGTAQQWINAFEYQDDATYTYIGGNIDTDSRDLNGTTAVMVYAYHGNGAVSSRTLHQDTSSGTVLATQTYVYTAGGLVTSKTTT